MCLTPEPQANVCCVWWELLSLPLILSRFRHWGMIWYFSKGFNLFWQFVDICREKKLLRASFKFRKLAMLKALAKLFVELLMCTEDIPPRCSRMRLEVDNISRNWPSFSTSTCRVQRLGWPPAQGRMWQSFRSVHRTVTCYFGLVLYYHCILHFLVLHKCFYILNSTHWIWLI